MGKWFRESLRRSMPNAPKRATRRVVPAFTVQTLQKNVVVQPPPTAGVFLERPLKVPTKFRRFYTRADFPVAMGSKANRLSWKVRESTTCPDRIPELPAMNIMWCPIAYTDNISFFLFIYFTTVYKLLMLYNIKITIKKPSGDN
jgi:hypothetical protein